MPVISELIGDFGKYQLWICFIIFIGKFGIAYQHMAIIFLAPPTSYVCPNANETCCDNPVFNRTIFYRTIISEWNLICERSWLKDMSQTLFQLGVLLGSVIFGIISDRYGRKWALTAAVIIEVFSGITSAFLPDYWSFTIFRCIIGLGIGGEMVVGFVIVMEYVGNTSRDVISALYHIPFTMGHMNLAIIGYFIRDFSYFQLAISLSNVILLLYICVLPETPRWLLAVGKTNEAIECLKRVALVNGMATEEIEREIILLQEENANRTSKKSTVLDLFKTPNLRKHVIIMSFNWLVCSYCFYGLSQYITHLTGNIFINVLCSGAVSMIGILISIPITKILGRKPIIILSNSACSLCLFLIPVIPAGKVSIVLSCLGVLFSFVSFVVLYLYCTEIFPTVARNAALGISSMMARLGSMISPFVVGLKIYGAWCPPFCFGVLPIVASCLTLFLPETKDTELMTTIEEGEALGRHRTRRMPEQNVNT